MQPLTADEIPEILARLVDKSLVHYDPSTGRYGLLQLVRQFAQEEIFRAGESAALRSHHLDYFYKFSRGKRVRTRGPGANTEFEATERDYEDYRLAVEWAILNEDTWAKGASIVTEIFLLWSIRAYIDDGIRWLKSVAEAAPDGMESTLSGIYALLATLEERQRSPELGETIERCLELARKSNNLTNLSRGLLIKARHGWHSGDTNNVDDIFEQASKVCVENHDDYSLGGVLLNRGNFAIYQGRFEDAARHMADTERAWETNPRGLSILNSNRAHLCERQGDYEGEHKWALIALRSFFDVFDRRNTAIELSNCCGGFWLAKDYVTAARLLGCCQGILDSDHTQGDALDGQTFARWEERLRHQMGDAAFNIALADGKHWIVDEAVKFLFANPEPWVDAK